MKNKVVSKLSCCINYKQSQVTEMCSFRHSLDDMNDRAAAELHEVSYQPIRAKITQSCSVIHMAS